MGPQKAIKDLGQRDWTTICDPLLEGHIPGPISHPLERAFPTSVTHPNESFGTVQSAHGSMLSLTRPQAESNVHNPTDPMLTHIRKKGKCTQPRLLLGPPRHVEAKGGNGLGGFCANQCVVETSILEHVRRMVDRDECQESL